MNHRLAVGCVCAVAMYVVGGKLALCSTADREIRLLLVFVSVAAFQIVTLLPVLIRGRWIHRLISLPLLGVGLFGMFRCFSELWIKYLT